MLALPGEISGAVTGSQRSPDEFLRFWQVIDLSSDGLYVGSFQERFMYYARRLSNLPGRWDDMTWEVSGPVLRENVFVNPNAVICPLFSARLPHTVL
jgi:hypothetical protein